MEITRSIQRETAVVVVGLQIITVVETITSWYSGKQGLYVGYSKKPLFVIIKSEDKITVLAVDGKPLTIDEAEKKIPGIMKDILKT
jgi:predicted ribosome-associated RNA-binding protein Tma20